MSTIVPSHPVGPEGIFPADIAGAIMGLRLDKITSVKWDLRPSVGIVAKDIERLGLDIRSFKEPLSRVVKMVMIPSIRKNFDAGGRPAWEPLAEGTIKRRDNSAWPILDETGKLRRKATQFNIWTITAGSATVRALPSDVFYGAFHQAGATRGNAGIVDELLSHPPGSVGAKNIIQKFVPAAIKDLERRGILVPGSSLTPELKKHIQNRAVGILIDSEIGTWQLPARPFIMWQEQDVPKIEAIFSEWMEERAVRVGRFRRE